MVLYILSQIWKNGGIIQRLDDGQLELKNHQKIPPKVLEDAEKFFGEIDAFIKSVDDMVAVDRFMWNIVAVSTGWQKNENIDRFFGSDEKAVNLFYEYTVILARNGWVTSGQDWREFETVESDKIKKEIFQRAMTFKKGVK